MARVLGSAPMGFHPVSTTGLATPTQQAICVPSPAPLPSQCAGTISGLDGPRPSGDGGDCPPNRPWCSLATPGLEDARPTEAGPPGDV